MDFESYSRILVLIFVALSFGEILFLLITQLRIASRRKISYANFEAKSRYFDLRPFPFNLLIICSIFIYGVTIAILLSLSNVTRIYILLNVPMLCILIFAFIYEIRIGSKNKDLSHYVELKREIEEIKSQKETYIKKLNVYESKLKSVKKDWYDLISILNSCISINVSEDYLDEIKHLDSRISNLKDNLDSFDNEYEEKFSNSLSLFIKNKSYTEFALFKPEEINEEEIEALFLKVKESIKELILSLSISFASKNEILSTEHLIKIIDLNLNLENDISELLKQSVVYLNNRKDRKVFLEYAYSKSLITFNFLLDCIGNNYYRILDNYHFDYFSQSNNVDLISFVLDEEILEALYPLLRNFESNIELFKKAIANVKTVNKCTELVKGSIELTNVEFNFGLESSLYENMAYALLNYYNHYGINKVNKIRNIIDSQTFIKNKNSIVEEYCAINNGIVNLKDSFISSFMLYINSASLKSSLFNRNKLIVLYKEYVSNLNVEKISILICLICSVILITENDSSIISEILPILEQNETVKKIYKDKITIKDYKNEGEKILKGLLTTFNKEILSIINRIEEKRLCYEKLARM